MDTAALLTNKDNIGKDESVKLLENQKITNLPKTNSKENLLQEINCKNEENFVTDTRERYYIFIKKSN